MSLRMSFPFIIWCRQRTGSISLFYSLCSASEHTPAQCEPFDADVTKDRQFTNVGKRMRPRERDVALRSICDDRFLIKHCYENLSEEFNHALAEISTRAGYRHIHLVRHNELARLISKGIAEQHGTWVADGWTRAKYQDWKRRGLKLPPLDIPAMKQYHELSESRWRALAGLLRPHEVMSENFFSVPRLVLSRITDYLGMPTSNVQTMLNNIGASQSTPSIWKLLPNIQELKDAIA